MREVTPTQPTGLDGQILVHTRVAWRVKGIIQMVPRSILAMTLRCRLSSRIQERKQSGKGRFEGSHEEEGGQLPSEDDREVRRRFHDDISIIVVYLDRHRGRRHTRVVDSSINCTNGPVDIYYSTPANPWRLFKLIGAPAGRRLGCLPAKINTVSC
ncbi:hypothetical protein OsJ_09073 [Oryza sativa Japonica Group]|uniref:Uncharacterized protein n=1 Tax=Oryza sativa subsp. japonica TaxID=39947 RepID=B9FAA8_ORYSJ|nr:hypothetical protein OsJ_09073 [Oryza sativa Japonica Group]